MGIDVYLKWEGQTEAEEKAQYTGFDTTAGNVGYLREAYHGGPYVTHHLMAECFDGDSSQVIPAARLRERLPQALNIARERARKVYREEIPPEVLQAFTDFVELAERKERETGKPVTIHASY